MFEQIAKLFVSHQRTYVNFLRISIFIVMAWIGGLKYFSYEANGIVPFVAKSPFMSFFYGPDKDNFKNYMSKEGELIEKNVAWHEANHTYLFADGLGTLIIIIGFMVLAGIWSPKTGLIGGLLTAGMSIVTLSFLITTPSVWVPSLGDVNHGFPYLSGSGRLVLKDIIMLAAAFAIVGDASTRILNKK